MGDSFSYSLTYERTDHLQVAVRGVSFQPVEGDPPDPFDAAGDLDYGVDWSGNATHAVFDIDLGTGDADVSFSWQAGNGDDKARVFNVFVDHDDAGEASGCGFFGYGSRFDGDGPSDNTISTFICNWAGPGNFHDGEIGYGQKQCMSTNTQGLFEPTMSQIGYAPVNDCDSMEDPDFGYKLANEVDYVTDGIVNDLVELGADSDFADYDPPEPPSGP